MFTCLEVEAGAGVLHGAGTLDQVAIDFWRPSTEDHSRVGPEASVFVCTEATLQPSVSLVETVEETGENINQEREAARGRPRSSKSRFAGKIAKQT